MNLSKPLHVLVSLLNPLKSPLRGQDIPKIAGFSIFANNFTPDPHPKRVTIRGYKKLVFQGQKSSKNQKSAHVILSVDHRIADALPLQHPLALLSKKQ